MKCSFLLLLLCLVAAATAKYYKACDSVGGRVNSVVIRECPDDRETCQLKAGKRYLIKIGWETDNEEWVLQVQAKATDKDVDYKMKLYAQTDACMGHGIACPMKKGEPQDYRGYFSVDEKGSPSPTVVMTWKFTNNRVFVGCVNVFVDLKD